MIPIRKVKLQSRRSLQLFQQRVVFFYTYAMNV